MQTRFKPSTSFSAERSICIAVLLAQGLLLGACVAEDVDPVGMGGTGGTSAGNGGGGQTGNNGGSGGSTPGGGGSGGGGGVTGDPEFGIKLPCVPPTQAAFLDFTLGAAPTADAGTDAGAADAAAPVPADGNASFGDFSTQFSGGTYVYPSGGAWPVATDVSGGNWHITGDIGDYSGFGLYFGGTIAPETRACTVVDLSAYDGISFTISGSVAMGNTLTMSVARSSNNVSHVWLNTIAMPRPNPPAERNSGTCIPASTNQFDGTCASPTTTITVTAEPTTVTVLWSQLMGGLPQAGVDPTEITGIAWSFPNPPGVGNAATAMPYPVDLVIDNFQFVNSP